MSNKDLIEIFSNILAWYHLFLIMAAAILNPFVMYICLKSRRLRSTTTFKLLAISAINDLICCLGWNQAQFTNTVLDFNSSRRSLLYCRVVTFFLQYSSIQYESWMLVSISVDRFLSMRTKKWTREYFKGCRPYAYAIALAFFIYGINFHEIFTMGYVYKINETDVIACSFNAPDAFPWNRVMGWVSQ